MSISNHPKISVVIVSWNVAQSLKQCLDSIFETQYPNLEIFVIDNASTDNSSRIVKSFKSVNFIQNTKNIGFPKALNIGLRQIKGEYIVVLNPDTRIPSSFFSQCLDFFNLYPRCTLMGPKLVNPDGTSQGSIFQETSIVNTFRESWLGQKGLTNKYTLSQTEKVFAISGACMVFPKTTLEHIGLFTEKVFMYFEDMDYCRRIRKSGGQVFFNSNITVIHEHGSSSKQSAKSNPAILPFWKGYLWDSSLWYNGPFKHYLLTFISWTGQKWHDLISK